MGWGEGKSFMVGGVNGMGESRFYDGWRGWGKESRLGWVALMEWEKESRFYGGQLGWNVGRKSFQDELVVKGWWKESRLAKLTISSG